MNVDGEKFLQKYLKSNGFPILTVERSGTNSLKITQRAFNADLDDDSPLSDPWIIQVPYFSSNNRRGVAVLDQPSKTVTLNYELAADEWYKLNEGSTGYYVVNYDDWTKLIRQLTQKATDIPVRDRANLLFDAGLLSEKTLMNYETLFSLIDYIKNEEEYLPWSVVNTVLSSLESKLTSIGSVSIVQFRAYIHTLIDSIYDLKVDFAADSSTLSYDRL